jgi:hypothetical protein
MKIRFYFVIYDAYTGQTCVKFWKWFEWPYIKEIQLKIMFNSGNRGTRGY